MSRGLTDKLYWRPPRSIPGLWHCFKKCRDGGYRSLCGLALRQRSGGQEIGRPPAVLRCARCDLLEMERRQAAASLPENENWRDHA